MKFKTRRLGPNPVRIVGRAPDDYAQELQERLEKLGEQVTGAIPGGFNSTTPTTIDGTTPATPGSESEGWAAADHGHALDISGTPGAVTLAASAQGSGPGVSLSSHTHQLDPLLFYDPVTDPFRVALNG